MAWDDAKRAKVIKAYQDAKPTGETSIEIVKQLAEEVGETANGVRMVLSKAEVYVKKEEKAGTTKTATTSTKVSKADTITTLKNTITKTGHSIDEEIISKLTGKQAAYFTAVILAGMSPTIVDESEE